MFLSLMDVADLARGEFRGGERNKQTGDSQRSPRCTRTNNLVSKSKQNKSHCSGRRDTAFLLAKNGLRGLSLRSVSCSSCSHCAASNETFDKKKKQIKRGAAVLYIL